MGFDTDIPTFTPPTDEPVIPTFTPPTDPGVIPTFTPPPEPFPTFTPPTSEPNIPTFTPPTSNEPNIPTFTPPTSNEPNIPTFTPPTSNEPNIPTFTPPTSNESTIPTFTPPTSNEPNIPTFTPPTSEPNIPTFTPPTGGGPNIPTFTPPPAPMPRFTPPRHNGPCCHNHPDEPAVAVCARCGKPICQDCAESFGVVSGKYAGQHLCFDCCEELVADNIEELTENKKKIKAQFILQLIGMSIGFFVPFFAAVGESFSGALIAGFIYGCVGGVFLSAMKAFFSLTWEAIKIAFAGEFGVITVISLFIESCVIVFKCIYVTISNTIFYIRYLKETQGFIESDTAALAEMRSYMEYTLVRSNNKGVSLEELMNEGSELYNNSYAQNVLANGEAAADAALREATTMINERGEIIRTFRAA